MNIEEIKRIVDERLRELGYEMSEDNIEVVKELPKPTQIRGEYIKLAVVPGRFLIAIVIRAGKVFRAFAVAIGYLSAAIVVGKVLLPDAVPSVDELASFIHEGGRKAVEKVLASEEGEAYYAYRDEWKEIQSDEELKATTSNVDWNDAAILENTYLVPTVHARIVSDIAGFQTRVTAQVVTRSPEEPEDKA